MSNSIKTGPKVSIIIPVYNGSNYLSEAIDSALAQTYKNIEIIVVNDGSNDNGATEKIAKSYGNKIRYIKKKNGGVASALNLGIRKMTGDYFSWLSHDDMYVPNRTEKMVHSLIRETDFEELIVASSVTYFTSTAEYSPVRPTKYMPSHPLSYLMLGYINGCAILIPRQVIIKEGFFNEKLPTTQDFDYLFRILRKNKLLYLNDELTLSRSHEAQGSKAMLALHIAECDELWINIARTLSGAEKVKIFGSELEFYNAVCDYLKTNTLYKKAIFYMKKQAFKIIRETDFDNACRPDFIEDWSVNIQKSKKTIFFPIFGYYNDRGGLNKMISMVANRLSQNFNVIVASYTDKNGGYNLNNDITYIHSSTNFSGVDCFEDISELFDVNIIAVSHNCSAQGLELINRLKLNKRYVIAWNHEDYFLPYSNPKFSNVWSIRNTVLASADAVIWPTNTSCEAYSLRADNGVVVPNFVHFEKNTKKVDSEHIHNNIIAIARFDDPRKRINLLLKTYENILLQRKDVTLTILGVVDSEMPYSETESIGDAITRINATTNNIKQVGFVDDIDRYYTKSDVHILPSYGEGFGLTILESAYYGVPTAVFNNSGFSDIISDGKNGIIAPEADTYILAQRIAGLYDNHSALLKMKKASKEILVKFDEDKVINSWEDLLRAVIYNKTIKFSRYKLDEQMIRRISDGFEGSLAKFSENFNYANLIKLEDENDNLEQVNAGLVIINDTMKDELTAIYNSKRWKYSAKIAALKGKLLK